MNRTHKYALVALLIGGARLLVPQEMNPLPGGQQQYQQNQQNQNQPNQNQQDQMQQDQNQQIQNQQDQMPQNQNQQDQIQNQIQNQVIQKDQNQQDQTQATQGTWGNTPLYRVDVIGREVPAINYIHRKGKTDIGFRGTSLLGKANGHATVDALSGRTMIKANFYHMIPASSFGKEYLTYVLWAITPEGRPVNLGEVLPTGKKDEDQITVSTNLQAFGLIVTAEPYFAVTMPSNLVTVENYVLKKTKGMVEQINVHYSLLPRGAYEQTAGVQSVSNPVAREMSWPLDLHQAENAVQIAEATGASQYAPDTMAAAKKQLDQAHQAYQSGTGKDDRKRTITYARASVQTAEDARLITIRKLRETNNMAADQQAGAMAVIAAAQAQQLAQQQAAASVVAQQAALATEQAQQQSDAARQAQAQARMASQQAQATRERLHQQLSQVMQTKETARGLIMDMPNVQFASAKYELKPDAQVKLAKVSGILLSYPDLRVQVEGYTDNVGSADHNQKLSEQRADSVRGFLVAQNVRPKSVTAQGFGERRPVANNNTDSGRAENRRVQLVITGASIGLGPNSQQQTPSAQNREPQQNSAPAEQQAPPDMPNPQ